jgi:hypothetical protein
MAFAPLLLASRISFLIFLKADESAVFPTLWVNFISATVSLYVFSTTSVAIFSSLRVAAFTPDFPAEGANAPIAPIRRRP